MTVTSVRTKALISDPRIATVQPPALEQAVFDLVSRTSSLVGEDYFAGVVASLTETLGCDSAFVVERGRRDPQVLRPLAVTRSGAPFEVASYALEGSAARSSLNGASSTHSNAIASFPNDAVVAAIRPEHVIIISVRTSDGTPSGFLGVGKDLPFSDQLTTEAILRLVGARVGAEIERLQATAELRETSAMLRTFMDRAEDIVLRTYPGPNPIVEYVNPAFETFMGYPAEDLYADPQLLLRIAHPDDREAFAKMLMEGDTGQRLIWRWIHRDGSIVWTEGKRRHIYDESGKLVALESIVRNITAQREAEQRATDAERIRDLVVASIPDTVLVVNRQGIITSFSNGPSGSPFLKEPSTGAALASLVPDGVAHDILRNLGAALTGGEMEVIRFTVPNPTGERHFEARFVPATDEQAIAFFRDITGDEFLSRAAEHEHAKEELEGKAERRILRRNPHGLTFREFTILELVAGGLTDKQIAAQLGISLNTVGKHVSNILRKMQVSSRTEASVHAVQQHLLD